MPIYETDADRLTLLTDIEEMDTTLRGIHK